MKMYKKCMKNFWMFAAFAVVLSVAGCGGDDEKEKEVKVTGFELNKTSVTLDPTETDQVNVVNVLPENATLKTYDWTTENEAVATVSAGGLVTAVGPGDTKLKVTARDGSGVFATVDVHVNDVDYGKLVAGEYEGGINIRTKNIEGEYVDYFNDFPITLVYVSTNKVMFEGEALINTLAFNGELIYYIEAGEVPPAIPATISAEMTISSDGGDGYLITGGGFIALPEDFAKGILGLPMPGTSFEIIPDADKEDDTIPYIDSEGNLFMRFEVLGLGEVFYNEHLRD